MNSPPLVSIIMPAYNAQKFIAQAIRSFLQQDYKNSELIIIDDGSTDQTPKIIQPFLQKNRPIRYFRNSQNLGIAKSRNFALHQAQGELIGHLDADDRLKKKAISRAVRELQKKKASLVYSGYILLDEKSHCKKKIIAPEPARKNLPLLGWQHFGLYRKKAALALGGFNEKLITCSDGDFFTRMSKKYRCARINDYLYDYRWHGKNVGHRRKHCFFCPQRRSCAYYRAWKKNSFQMI